MIAVDTSALLAILLAEPEMAAFRDILAEAPRKVVSSVSLPDAAIVMLSRRGDAGKAALDELVEDAELEVIPFDVAQYDLAVRAFEAYGKGLHSARLNICDCIAYALAKGMNAPLLFKGNDFSATDVIATYP